MSGLLLLFRISLWKLLIRVSLGDFDTRKSSCSLRWSDSASSLSLSLSLISGRFFARHSSPFVFRTSSRRAPLRLGGLVVGAFRARGITKGVEHDITAIW